MTPPSASTELPPRLGPYLLGPVVGTGRAAVVVRARDTRFDADVAIKVRHHADAATGEAFLREGQVLRRVTHPALVAVHEVGQAPDGRPYLVMDLARDSLTDRLRTHRARVDAGTLLAVISALADGLGALHAIGIAHGDVTPSNLLLMGEAWAADEVRTGTVLAADERIVLADLGLAGESRRPGFRAPEQLLDGARADARADVYAATAVLWSLVTGRTPPPADAVGLEVASVPAEWRELIRTGMAADPASRFPDIDAWARAARDVLGADTQDAAEVGTRTATGATTPYKGLATLQPEDTGLFFGRSPEVDTLVARLAQYPVLVVTGASGSGKSSLVRAGLLPWLRAAGGSGEQDATTCLLTPGERPLRALTATLDPAGSTGLTAEALRAEPAAVLEVPTGPLILVVDQFEELFTLCGDREERAAFLDVLTALTIGDEPRARVVLTVRADFYAACATHPWIAAAANTNQVLVEPMSRVALRQVIEGPAAQVGLRLADGLPERMLAEAGDRPAALPLLAYALARTWARHTGDRMTVSDYVAVGGVAGAVSSAAEELWGALDAAAQTQVRRLMLRMVQPGDATPDVPRTVDWADLSRPARDLLAPFVEAGLLTLDIDGVRFAHDAVLGAWPRLAGWLVESREEVRVSRHMERAAEEWERSGRRGELLLHGVALAAALDWRTRQQGDIPYQVAMFLTEAESVALAAADAEHAAARRERARRRRMVVGLSAAAAVALVGTAAASTELIRENGDAQPVVAAGAPPPDQTPDARIDPLGDPMRATAAALRALTDPTAPTDARAALIRARLALAADRMEPSGSSVMTRLAALDSAPIALAVNADASVLAVGLGGDGVRLIETATGAERGTLRAQGTVVSAVAFLGERFVTGDEAGGLRIWSPDGSGTTAVRTDAHSGPITTITTVGDRVLSAGADGLLRLWSSDLTQTQHEVRLDGEPTAISADPDSGTVAALVRDDQVIRWTPATGAIEVVATLDGARSVALNGDTLAVGHGTGQVTAWTLLAEGGSRLRWEHGGALGDGPAVAFATPEVLVAADYDGGRLRFRDVSTGDVLGAALPATGKGQRRVVTGPDGTAWAVDREGTVWRSDVLAPQAACRALEPGSAQRAEAGPVCG